MSAERARDFLSRIEASNVGTETLTQLIDDLRRLVIAYEHQPLPTLLSELVDTQDRAFGLLEESVRYAQSGAEATARSTKISVSLEERRSPRRRRGAVMPRLALR